eukprot:1158274-Pelagomonas_calceolata.AAC.62
MSWLPRICRKLLEGYWREGETKLAVELSGLSYPSGGDDSAEPEISGDSTETAKQVTGKRRPPVNTADC